MTTTIGSLDLGALSDLREDVTQYFWFESDSTSAWGSGAHVTLYPESQFTDPNNANYIKGQNILMNTDGFSIRNGALPMMVLDNDSLDFNAVDTNAGTYTTLATFGLTGATIGKSNGAHSVIDANGQRFYGSDGTTQLANIGYGLSASGESTISVSPYYTFGIRRTATTATALYDSSTTYNIGDICVYDSKVYVCIVAITTPENWNYEHWKYYIGSYSYASGWDVIASGYTSHAEGRATEASVDFAHAEGFVTKAYGDGSHAEGWCTITDNSSTPMAFGSRGNGAHAEGYYTKAYGQGAHAEGYYTTADGRGAHAGGRYSEAIGSSFAHGNHASATSTNSFVIGAYNIKDNSGSADNRGQYAFIIGNGTDEDNLSNALTVDWYGGVAFDNPSRTFVVKEYTHSFSAISSGGHMDWSEQVSETGYYPIGVMGFRTSWQALVVNMCQLTNQTSGSCTLRMNARAVANVSASTAVMKVLWIKET